MPPVGQSGSIQVGDKVYATIDGDTLTLSGSGSIWDSDAAGHWSEVMSDSEKRGITKIEFVGNEITSIGNEVFWNFTGVKYVELPESILELGHDVFAYCESLEKIILPDALKVIPSGAFYNCVNLKEFTVPETVIEINSGAFGGCTELTNVTIPKSVTYFGNDVFRDCRNLTIHGFRDSAAERYANNNYIPFVSVDFKVIFKVDGRTVGDPQYIKAGGDAKPPELTKEGYTLSWDADYTDIQEDMIINAVWTKNGSEVPQPTPTPQPPIIIYPPEDTKYTVTFKDRGKTIKTEKVKSGEAADLPYIARYGYELSWDKDFSKVTSNMTVNAIWTIMKPEKVTSLTAEIISKKISLSWDESEYAGYYKIYRKASTDKEFILAAKTSQTLWNDRKAKSGVKYQYKAVAVRSVSGELYTSPESDIATVKLGAPEKGQIYTVGKLNYKVMNNTQVRVTGAAKVSGSVVIPKTVTICDKVFKVTSIDHKAFYQNANLINVEIGDYVTYVGQYSFYRCPNLETVKIGKNVEVISTCAFTECPKLGNVTLPGKMRRLGAKVFYHCPKLKVLYIKTNYLEYIGKKGLAIDKKTTIKVPSRKYSAYKKMIEDSVKFAATKIVKL